MKELAAIGGRQNLVGIVRDQNGRSHAVGRKSSGGKLVLVRLSCGTDRRVGQGAGRLMVNVHGVDVELPRKSPYLVTG